MYAILIFVWLIYCFLRIAMILNRGKEPVIMFFIESFKILKTQHHSVSATLFSFSTSVYCLVCCDGDMYFYYFQLKARNYDRVEKVNISLVATSLCCDCHVSVLYYHLPCAFIPIYALK